MKLYVVALGPGAGKNMTLKAKEILDQSEYIVGYKNYVGLIEVDFMDKKFIKTELGNDVEACHSAMQKAVEGSITSLVVSGDAAVYTMSSLLLKIAKEYPDVEIEPVGGLTSTAAAASAVGAPVSDDFVQISLSDADMPWEIIERRLLAAVDGGFVIAIHTPVTVERMDALRKACRIILWKRKPETVCAYVKGAGTWGEKYEILSLEKLFESTEIDMNTTVFIGNDQSEILNGKMHTPRGYSAIEALGHLD